MPNKPILILQMQRMGDLVLSFPLLGWLKQLYPNNPLWVVGEESFFTPLMPLSPEVTYFPYSSQNSFVGVAFFMVINLSHRPEAAKIAGRVKADEVVGAYQKNDALYVRGNWQLYRTSITHNNHYNFFHWADLNALDLVPLAHIKKTRWPFPKKVEQNAENKRLGLFLGASEVEKRPDAEFWINLTQKLLQAGYKPVLLGGQGEKELGAKVASALKIHALNLCGRFSVKELANFITNLDLLITPDTGPMHIASWVGTRVLNLSLGPVNPWETAPSSPEHFVVRANMNCVGCWQCTKPSILCKEQMKAEYIANIVQDIFRKTPSHNIIFAQEQNNVEFLKTARNREDGLFELVSLTYAKDAEAVSSTQSTPSLISPSILSLGQSSTLSLGQSSTSNLSQQCSSSLSNQDLPSIIQQNALDTQKDYWQKRNLISRFWQAYFGYVFGIYPASKLSNLWQILASSYPEEAVALKSAIAELLGLLLKTKSGKNLDILQNAEQWKKFHAGIWPLTGYLQMYASNEAANPKAFKDILDLVEKLYGVM